MKKVIRKNRILLMLMIAVSVAVLAGCGSKKAELDASGNAPITARWRLVQFTVNGKVTRINEQPWWMKVLFAGKNPSFSSPDGVKCVFSNNGKARDGRISLEDGVYHITFDGATAGLNGVISGRILTITNEKGTLEFIFETQ